MSSSSGNSNRYSFGAIQPVPPLSDFLDIVLSRTQRKTPTVVHKGYSIGRIREFYLRKVKFTCATFDEKLGALLEEFPRLDDVHPFYADLMNILYDKDHYKLALGQINTARHLIEGIGKEYCKLLKFGDSLYRCKQLKRAALGRMATVMKRQKETLLYLEQVRQHLSRLPCIDPNTRTLLLCGFPNVGKSSFMNMVTRADVEVQPYAFTTKSLFVGHMDYRYLRWQVIDTPGILDRPLEERNTIEMQSITALAHLRACILYFLDVSGSCGYSVQQQVNLFRSVTPLFAQKPILIVLTKIDLVRPENVESADDRALLQSLLDEGHQMVGASCVTSEGVMEARNVAAERLLAMRVEQKVRGQKIGDVLNRLHLAQPASRDTKDRPVFIPEKILERRNLAQTGTDTQQDSNDDFVPEQRLLAKDIELANGGPGVYNINLREKYMLAKEDWKQDLIPEIMNGKNIFDFIDPDIEERLLRLEAEEEALEASGVYDETQDLLNLDQKEMRAVASKIRDRKHLLRIDSKMKRNTSSRPVLVSRHRRVTRMDTVDSSKMDIDDVSSKSKKPVNRMLAIVPKRDRSVLGLRTGALTAEGIDDQIGVVSRLHRLSQKKRNQDARRGESDRRVLVDRPKHLFSGKRSNGTASHR